jgi:ubiquinone/menaquinone biosynthesis C-methylase UbiE
MDRPFYKQIEEYYDGDAADFDARYWQNPVLQRIRQDFREEVKLFSFSRVLEIGYGTGIDLVHFALTHPEAEVAGIDISAGMQKVALEKIKREGLNNVRAEKGRIEDIERLFPGKKFDLVYVFFGALNTVDNLEKAADLISRHTAPGGILVLSFVNKYYVAGMIIEMAKLRFRAAFSRLRPEWGGYSPSKYLPSRCYSPRQIKNAFSGYRLLKKRGYSIIHPAWYYHRLNRLAGRYRRYVWKADMMLQNTPFWKYGEYTLFVFQKPDHISE